MIIDFNRYNGGGGSGSGVTPAQVQQQINSALTPYWESGETKDYVDNAVSGISLEGYATSGDMQSAFTLISETQQVAAAGLNQLEGRIDELSGATPTNSPIIPAITTQAEYEAISGDVKTGDLIQVQGVDINGDNNPEYGLFGAYVQEEEDEGVVRKLITWYRKDNENSVLWSSEDFPWMDDYGILPIDLDAAAFIISPDLTSEDEAYNGIGFDDDGKPVITHFAPQYDEETGEITGMTREDTPIGTDMSAYWNSAETKTYVDNRIDGSVSTVTLSAVSTDSYLRMDGSTVCTAGDIAWQALSRPVFNTTNIQQFEIGNDPYDPGLGTVNYLKFKYVFETNNVGEATSVYYALPDNGEFVEGVPVQLTRTTSQPSTVYNTPAGTGRGYFIWDNVNLTITWNRQPVAEVHTPGVVKSDGVITKVQKLTQAEYDAITTKDPHTFYIIVNN